MARRYRMPDITVRIPFETTEPGRVALLRSAGIPLDAQGALVWGFLHERRPGRFGAGSICRWFATASTDPLPVMTGAGLSPAHGF
ncbi:hypothetical protein [Variovorax sp. 38R]|uniref:hypothetical protein n=1 Tax=Variovorax sp. 38R TaxID=2774875 RepID=UPI00177F1DEA|nr:hypothetical protein [Variovorax sp. 38R]QOF76134.1 hypothetical protein IG196_17200 [Variovorax sp. 38R]